MRPNREINESKFFITVNTNKRPRGDEEIRRMLMAMENTMEYVTNRPQSYIKFVMAIGREHPYDIVPDRSKNFNQNIVSVDSEYGVELGGENEGTISRGGRGRGGRIHSHSLLKIVHRDAKIQLHYGKLKAFFIRVMNRNGLNVRNIHLDVKQVHSDSAIRRYLSKASPVAEQIINNFTLES